MPSLDSFKSKRTLTVGSKTYTYFSLSAAAENGLGDVSRLPASLKVLLENMLRHEDGKTVTKDDILAFKSWLENKGGVSHEIAYRPARVLMQDFTGVPAVVDLAAMRDAAQKLGASADAINPRHRPLGHGRQLRRREQLRKERRNRIQAQPGAV